MIKIVHTADWHIFDRHKYSVDDSRLKEIEKNLTDIIWWCVDNNVDILVVAGDIFHNYNPSEKLMKIFSRIVMTAVTNGVSVRVITGNHDTDGDVTSLDSVGEYVEWVIDKKKFNILKHKNTVMSETISSPNSESVFIQYVPWNKNLKAIIKKAKESQNKNSVNILFTHASVAGAITNTGVQLKGDKAEKMDLKPIDLIGWDYVGLGDFHKCQQIGNDAYKKKNNVWYCGSPFKLDWGERDHKKGFNVITIIGKEIKLNKVNLKDINFLQVDIDYDNLDSLIDDNNLDVKNSFIKLFITSDIKTKDVMKKGYAARENLLRLGARDVYVFFKKKVFDSETNELEENDNEIKLDFDLACLLQLKGDNVDDKKYMEYIKSLQVEVLSQ